MAIEVGKITLDFDVQDNFNPKHFSVVDRSEWKSIKDKPAIIEICTPGSEAPVVHYFQKGEVNVFNSLSLNLNCGTGCSTDCIDIPDGIYRITLKGSPDKFFSCKDYLRTVNLQRTIDSALLEDNTSESIKSNICDFEMLIKAAEANVRCGNFSNAQELFEMAEKKAKDIKGCTDCV